MIEYAPRSTRGRRFKKRITSMSMNEAEVELSIMALRIIDRLEWLEDELAKNPEAMVENSRKDRTINPIIREIRGQEQALASVLKQMNIPPVESEEEETGGTVVPMSRHDQARKAANVRWGKEARCSAN